MIWLGIHKCEEIGMVWTFLVVNQLVQCDPQAPYVNLITICLIIAHLGR